jgi:hypothetical protein
VSPFLPERWRPLRLVLDDATLTAEEIAVFGTFSEDDELELWHTRADLGAHLEIGDEFETPFPMGGARSVHAVSPESGTLFGIYGVERLRQRSGEIAAVTAEAEDDVFAALAFAAASDEMDADGFVTRRAYVLERNHHNDPVAFVPEDAFGLIGLIRRARGNSSLGRDMMDLRLGGSTYHFVLERELLRDAWPWFSAIVSSGTQNNDRSLVYLGQTARERFTRVLQIRDRLHFAAKGEPTRARGDEVVFQLETLLMFLSAAFDAAARVAHVVYFGSDYSAAGWRRERWRERLRQLEPALAALADDGTHGGAILQMVGALRNTIHGEGLRSGEFRESGQRPAQLVRVTEKEGERLTRLLEHIGGDPAVWGLEERRDEVWLAADRFVEALVPQATALLNQLMAKTDARRLPGAAGAAVARLVDDPSPEWWRDMLSFEIRQRVRLLSGM